MTGWCLAALLAIGAAAEEPAPEAPVAVGRTLESGTGQGFSLRVGPDGALKGLSISQTPASEEERATGAILYLIDPFSEKPATLHVRIAKPGGGNFDREIADAIAEKRFPAVVSSGATITLQLLRGRKGAAVGTPMSAVYGTPAAGTAGAPSRGASGCRAGECFEERFAQCKTARLDSKTRIDLSYRYEILGPGRAGCRVRSTFLLHPNEDWAGKSMVCVYDAGKPFAESIQKPLSCAGALADAMRAGAPQ